MARFVVYSCISYFTPLTPEANLSINQSMHPVPLQSHALKKKQHYRFSHIDFPVGKEKTISIFILTIT